jgi:predicted nucleic acid-binding protein
MTIREVFLDTFFAIALAVVDDGHHMAAVKLARSLREAHVRLITTRAVLFEIGNALASQRHRSGAIELLRSLEEDPDVIIEPLTTECYARAFQLYSERPDKEWGLIGCWSFLVMTDRGIADALTADSHFRQAGFRALLLEP